MGLDAGRLAPLRSARLDDVGIDRSPYQEARLAGAGLLFLEHTDELLADDATLELGIGDPGQSFQKRLGGVHRQEPRPDVVTDGLCHGLRLTPPPQPAVPPDTSEVIHRRA